MFGNELVSSANGRRKQKKKTPRPDWMMTVSVSVKAAATLRREKTRQNKAKKTGLI